MKTLRTKWTGLRPLILHNGLMADPTNPYTRQIKELTKKRTKTDADLEAIARLEWEAALYWNDEEGMVMPSDNIERCIQLGAQKSRLGKDVAAAVFVDEPEVKIHHRGPATMDELYSDPRFVLRKGVKVATARVIRVRPMIPTGWFLTFSVEYDENIVDQDALCRAIRDAGALVGLGDWRPKFGRFAVEFLND